MSASRSAIRSFDAARGVMVSLALLALAGACRIPHPPDRPEVIEVAAGTVRAGSKAKAAAVANMLVEFTPRVTSALPGCAKRHIDVRLVDHLARDTWGGVTYTLNDRRWIELPENEPPERIASTLVHELVHYLLGPDWSTLPGVLEEGLCDNVAHGIVPSAAPLERAEYAVMLASAIFGNLRFDAPSLDGRGANARFGIDTTTYTVRAPIERDELPSFEEALGFQSRDLEPIRAQGVRGVLDALGYLVVSRIGIEELHALCLRARMQQLPLVPAAWIFGAAQLDPRDHAAWRDAILEQFGDAERRALLKQDGLRFREQR
jgi:hypothetical protein